MVAAGGVGVLEAGGERQFAGKSRSRHVGYVDTACARRSGYASASTGACWLGRGSQDCLLRAADWQSSALNARACEEGNRRSKSGRSGDAMRGLTPGRRGELRLGPWPS